MNGERDYLNLIEYEMKYSSLVNKRFFNFMSKPYCIIKDPESVNKLFEESIDYNYLLFRKDIE
jgi:hypothetical protein